MADYHDQAREAYDGAFPKDFTHCRCQERRKPAYEPDPNGKLAEV